MNLKPMGLIASLMLGGAALAQSSQPSSMEQPPSQESKKSESKAQKESKEQAQWAYHLDGTVVSSREDKLYIKGSDGAVIPVDVNHKTRIEGKELSKSQDIHSHLQREFKEGDQVRTSFAVEKKTENVATSIDKAQK
jgi:hypothetical protein